MQHPCLQGVVCIDHARPVGVLSGLVHGARGVWRPGRSASALGTWGAGTPGERHTCAELRAGRLLDTHTCTSGSAGSKTVEPQPCSVVPCGYAPMAVVRGHRVTGSPPG